jgi:cell division protein FtsI (penicillin-binding protein 3)
MEQRSPRLRWLMIWIVAVVWMAAVVGRLGYLQLFCYSDYFAKAQHQQQRTFELSPTRGPIYDRKGHVLAESIPMDSVFADPADIHDPGMVARLLSRVLDVPPADLEQKINDASKPVRLAKKLSPETVDRIANMNLKGVFFQKENRRIYPLHELAAHVVGYVDTDEKGTGGIEHSLDKWIRGKAGRVMVMSDGKRRFYDPHEAAPDPGASVVLTIDQTLQYIAEKELATGMEENHATSGAVVIQDPNTGNLLAVANYPVFDPNDAGKYSDDNRMDRAVTAAYEPGSTFKMVTMAGAIERGLTNPNEMIDCQMGSIVVAGRLIHDHKPFGVLSVSDVLANSSDVGTIKIAVRMGDENFYKTIRDFGFGQLTNIELPAENHGMLHPLDKWTPNSIGSVAIGQEVSVTPVQIISAISAIANGGTLFTPRIVEEIRGGPATPLPARAEPRPVIDQKTAATLREMMETVILKGTGKPAHLDGYTAAGKSGTAQKIDPNTKRYSPNQYVASFVGFAPVNTPALTILVMFDSPVGQHMGGNLGGPVFKRVAEQSLAYLEVPHDVPLPSDVETAGNLKSKAPDSQANAPATAEAQTNLKREVKDQQQFQSVAAKTAAEEFSSSATVPIENDAVEIPNFVGQSPRAVIEACSRLGIAPSLIGNGVALEQTPDAGTSVVRGSQVTVRFGRAAGRLVPASSPRVAN